MKKILSLILTFLLLTSMLTGCGLLGGSGVRRFPECFQHCQRQLG